MPPVLDLIDTIVIVMMENRSFDHLLGYLRLPAFGGMKLDGIVDDAAWRQRYANPGKAPDNFLYEPILQHDLHIQDPPHERADIKVQLGAPSNGVFPMKGFVRSANGDAQVMHYYTRETVPIMDFFARNFLVCDRWFAPLPAGTQANRLMAMSGYTEIDTNVGDPIEFPDQTLAYDWLDQKKVNWRVYHQGFFPFFSMMPRLYEKIAGAPMFRRFDRLAVDFKLESDAKRPRVIFVEPKYTDAPHLGEGTDDHSPSSVLGGQQLLLDIYKALIGNPARWRKTVMIVTYDEHGGLFDHVQPLPLVTKPPVGAKYRDEFTSSGIRVPGLVISPLVKAGEVYSGDLDHISILKLLGQKFGGGSYSAEVDARGVGSVLDTLGAEIRQTIPPPPVAATIQAAPQFVRGVKPQTNNVTIFSSAAAAITQLYPHDLATKFPEYRDFFGILP
ncbi:MAG TPA: alkaline phosphatase family protein [Candidatus Binataceae bacterium]|nr:alkaline phosphatase family protein [Candidatus Binataceae bacterium]